MEQDLIQKTILEKASDPWWLESEKKVVEKYGRMFNPANLDQLTKEDFKSFLLIKNNLHWEGIHRQSNLVTSDMAALKRCLENLQLCHLCQISLYQWRVRTEEGNSNVSWL